MEPCQYWSKTNKRYIKLYAVIGEELVQLFYEDLAEFKQMTVLSWNMALHTGDIKLGWE
jgi:hypothetical protein